ncbi:hypothetical protein P43SY_010433 [Pythium insidiosum]|uniref:Uncharacterized protein n=1 Tax=Pythium insidiosum TaxID=114742 RepID=A0AAD5Q512_PYTIN|nr:hypothetical protein P43SY_010433 [Pythium insidiosum]
MKTTLLLRHLRNLDRWIHAERYPELIYPELYLIDGGNKNCFETLKVPVTLELHRQIELYADQCKRDFATLRNDWRQHKTSNSVRTIPATAPSTEREQQQK